MELASYGGEVCHVEMERTSLLDRSPYAGTFPGISFHSPM